jgi:hypothetical protein
LPADRSIRRSGEFHARAGAQSIIVAEIEYVFAPDSPLFAKLIAGL